jgi:hypothetical protein
MGGKAVWSLQHMLIIFPFNEQDMLVLFGHQRTSICSRVAMANRR